MAEKVLGFREKDAEGHIWTECKTNRKLIEIRRTLTMDEHIRAVQRKKVKFFKEIELVPVVSLKWLERYCKKRKPNYINAKNLLFAAREEVNKK